MAYILFIVIGVFLNSAAPQTIDNIMATQIPVTLPSTGNQWDQLLPALKMIKSTSSIKKERLLNVVKIIKYLLSDEVERTQCDKILEDIKATDDYQCPEVPDFDSIVEERLRPINEAIDGKTYEPNNEDVTTDPPKNNTTDFNKILAKISAALAKVKENNENAESLKQSGIVPIFKTNKCGCNNAFETTGNIKQNQAGTNPKSNIAGFNIPCQRAADILEETSSYVIPKDAFCDLPNNFNLNSILNNPKINADNLPFKIVPNSVSCVDSNDSIAILFKPKKISLMQVYGNLLKKITITVLVPYYVSKIAV